MAKIVEKIEENPQVAQQVLIALLKTDARNAVEVELRKHKEVRVFVQCSLLCWQGGQKTLPA